MLALIFRTSSRYFSSFFLPSSTITFHEVNSSTSLNEYAELIVLIFSTTELILFQINLLDTIIAFTSEWFKM